MNLAAELLALPSWLCDGGINDGTTICTVGGYISAWLLYFLLVGGFIGFIVV